MDVDQIDNDVSPEEMQVLLDKWRKKIDDTKKQEQASTKDDEKTDEVEVANPVGAFEIVNTSLWPFGG